MKTICIYCSSSNEIEQIYLNAAWDMGKRLAEDGYAIVYGGSDRGSMGYLARGAIKHGGRVTGVITRELYEKFGHKNESSLIITGSWQERKRRMFELSDACIALPGGFGTLDEIFEVLTWKMVGDHKKPTAFFNVEGYFNGLMSFLRLSMTKKFIPEKDWEETPLIDTWAKFNEWLPK